MPASFPALEQLSIMRAVYCIYIDINLYTLLNKSGVAKGAIRHKLYSFYDNIQSFFIEISNKK